MAGDPSALLATVAQAHQQLAQLEATTKGLIDELAAVGGAGTTPRLRELLSTGERLVASVAQAGQQLGSALPSSSAALPLAPSAEEVEAVWAQHAQQESGAALLPTPVSRPAPSLAELQYSLAFLPSCRLQLLQGRQPADAPTSATALLLRCERAFAAVVHLQQPGGLQPLRVGVLSAAEADAASSGTNRSAAGSSGSGSTASLWAPSQHTVHRQLSARAAAAMQHFVVQQQQQAVGVGGASPLELLLLWLVTCSDAFTRTSTSSGSLLLADPAAASGGLLPPLHRPWQLSWDQLWQAAVNPQLRQAEHLAAGEC